MTGKERLIEQHIREYESRLKHMDELLARAHQELPEAAEANAELAELDRDREKLIASIDEMKRRSREEWQHDEIEKAGPMIIWQAVAKRLEQLLERLER